MKRRRHSPEQIIRLLAEGEKLLGQGQNIEEPARHPCRPRSVGTTQRAPKSGTARGTREKRPRVHDDPYRLKLPAQRPDPGYGALLL